jgi:poly(3-hydroxyalkanoate) synthetase
MIKTIVDHHLPLFSLESASKNEPVLIVGNAYGVMPYVHPLALNLHESGYNPFWFAFSGQDGTKGIYSYSQGVEDIRVIVEHIKEETSAPTVKLISHCAGSLFTLEYLKHFPDSSVSKLIIYGLLYSMSRRRKIAERRLRQSGVKYALSEEDWNYNPLAALSTLKIPTFFCHAQDSLNTERATHDEMTLAVAATNNSSIRWFKEGYDNDTDLIKEFMPYYRDFLNSI